MPTNGKGALKQENNLLFLYTLLFEDLRGTFKNVLLILFYFIVVQLVLLSRLGTDYFEVFSPTPALLSEQRQ